MAVRMRMEQAVARAVAGATDAGDAYTRALCAIAEGVEWPLAAAWEPDDVDPDVLRCVAIWAADEEGPRAFAEATRATTMRQGEGLPGRVWQSGRALWITDAATDDRLPRRPAAAAAGLHAAVGFPVRSERGLVGVVEVFGATRAGARRRAASRRSRSSASSSASSWSAGAPRIPATPASSATERRCRPRWTAS